MATFVVFLCQTNPFIRIVEVYSTQNLCYKKFNTTPKDIYIYVYVCVRKIQPY